jgi:hypothetical protein
VANPTQTVPSSLVEYADAAFYWPLIGGATVAKTYQVGEMIGRRADGYAGSFDDTAAMVFLGILRTQIQVVAGDANGAQLALIERPYRINMPLDTSTVSRVTNHGARMYAADSGHASLSAGTYGNIIGNLVDVLGTSAPGALTGTTAVIQPQTGTTLLGPSLVTGAGAGITAGTGTVYKSGVQQSGGIIKTEILIDLTGLASSTTDLDIIGVGTDPAHIGRITAAQNGTILAIRMTCLELPAGGADDIDLYAATEGTGIFDGGIAALTETALITAGGAWASGTVKASTEVPAANQYLYLTGGEAGTAATYTAGKFLIEIFGY